MTFIKDLLGVNFFHVFDEELDVLNLLDDCFTLGLSCKFCFIFDKLVFPATQEDNDIKVLVILLEHGFKGHDEFEGPHKEKDDIDHHNSEKEDILALFRHGEISVGVVS